MRLEQRDQLPPLARLIIGVSNALDGKTRFGARAPGVGSVAAFEARPSNPQHGARAATLQSEAVFPSTGRPACQGGSCRRLLCTPRRRQKRACQLAHALPVREHRFDAFRIAARRRIRGKSLLVEAAWLARPAGGPYGLGGRGKLGASALTVVRRCCCGRKARHTHACRPAVSPPKLTCNPRKARDCKLIVAEQRKARCPHTQKPPMLLWAQSAPHSRVSPGGKPAEADLQPTKSS